jgi:hypothetical protein
MTAFMLPTWLDIAAGCNNLAAVMWLREQGSNWPKRFKNGPWGAEVLEWATSEGFIAPTN